MRSLDSEDKVQTPYRLRSERVRGSQASIFCDLVPFLAVLGVNQAQYRSKRTFRCAIKLAFLTLSGAA